MAIVELFGVMLGIEGFESLDRHPIWVAILLGYNF